MTAADMSNLHVLVVEDDVLSRNLIVAILNELETGKISLALNGFEALSVLMEATWKVDVILLDLEMPRLNGYEFIKKLRHEHRPPIARTPVVVISGHSEKKAFDRTYELGVDLYLVKPITKEQVLTRINAAVR